MAIPPELQQIIAQAKQRMPQLAHLPDEVVAQLILQAMQEQQAGPPAGSQDLASMSAEELTRAGEQLRNVGRWQEAERYFLQAMENAENANNLQMQTTAATGLASLCLQRGDFPQAMALYQQALALAERFSDRRLMGVIYELAAGYGNLGNVYLRQGDYDQAIQAYKRSLGYSIKIGADQLTANQYGNLGIVYKNQNQYDLATEMFRKGLEITLRIGDQQQTANNYGRSCIASCNRWKVCDYMQDYLALPGVVKSGFLARETKTMHLNLW